jgi:hypothetical protein
MRIAMVLAFLLAACGGKHDEPAAGSAEKPHHHEDRGDPATAPAQLRVDVVVDGKPAVWDAAAFAKVPHQPGTNNGGEARDMWSLRDLAHQLAGDTARVVAVTGDVTKAIDAAAWSDPARTPILHTTRRGTLKFRWADKAGAWQQDIEVKDVTKLELATQ